MAAEGEPTCGYVDCGLSAVGSRAVRGTLWFATHSRLAADNGEDPHWHIGGTIAPVDVMCVMHVCEAHNVVTEEVHSLD